jgi:hypothetical protein
MSGVLKRHLLYALFMAALVSPSVYALGMGEIRVNSHLGEPFKARIDLLDFTAADAQNFNASLASVEEYQKRGLQYPAGNKFKFQLVNERGAQPFIRVATPQPIDDPFVSLLVEVSSPSGKLLKHHIFLLDPVPGLPRTQVADLSSKSAHRQKNREHSSASIVAQTSSDHNHSKPFGRLSLSLSMALSVPANHRDLSRNLQADNDALQEELIAKDKTLNELNSQISEMQALIKKLHAQTGERASVATAEPAPATVRAQVSEAAVASPVDAVSDDAPISTPVVAVKAAGAVSWNTLFIRNLQQSAPYWLLMLLAAVVIFWFRNHEARPARVVSKKMSAVPKPRGRTSASLPVRLVKPPTSKLRVGENGRAGGAGSRLH